MFGMCSEPSRSVESYIYFLPDALLISRDINKVSIHQKRTYYARIDTRIPFNPWMLSTRVDFVLLPHCCLR